MRGKFLIAVSMILAGALLLFAQLPAAAAPLGQAAYPSPTPGPDGRIIYIVKSGDTCERLSLLYGVSVEYIRTTNLLDQNCTLRVGQPLLLGIGGPSIPSATPGPSPTPTPVTPTPTPGVGGTAEVCVLVYDDLNGDALRQANEPAIANAAISLTSLDGLYSKTQTSVINPDATAYQGMCFSDVPAGKYTVSAAAPDGYNPTIGLSSTVEVGPGDIAYVDFGAQVKAEGPANTPGRSVSPLLGVVGAALLLGGIGLGIYAWRMLRRR